MASLLLSPRVFSRNASLSRILINTVHCKEPANRPFIFPPSRTFASSPLDSLSKSNVAANLMDDSVNFKPDPEPLMDLTQFLSTVPPEVVPAVAQNASHLTATDLGLTWWLPTGGVYNIFDALSASCPWWASIAILAVSVRALMLPIMVKNQITAIEIRKLIPERFVVQNELSEAIKSQSGEQVVIVLDKMQQFEKKLFGVMSKVPLRMLAASPVYISIFYTLRTMAEYPIISMKTGGLFWFTDLTITDPYYLLPLLISVSLHLILRMGIEFGRSQHLPPGQKKIFLYAMPGLTFVFLSAWGCPSAVLLYFAVNNLISLVQSIALHQKAVKAYLKIPEDNAPDIIPPKSITEQREIMMKAIHMARDYAARQAASQAFKEPPQPPKSPKND